MIGLYAGSFNPYHKGHENIRQKASKIFDEVIVAFGKNPEKKNEFGLPPLNIGTVIFYDGLVTDLIERIEKEGNQVTLIRGLRNSTDLQYELTQYRFLQELKPDIKVVSIFCDKEYEHISSSGIKTLQKYGKGDEYLIK
jgi:cytidyltransferase-like protein